MSSDEPFASAATQLNPDDRDESAPLPRFLLGLAVIVLIFAASIWLALNPAWVLQFGRWGYVGAFIISLIASATIILPAPGIAVIIAMGGALDPVLLGIVAGIGSAFGELSGYLAGAGGRTLIPQKQQHWFDRIHRLTDQHGALILGFLAAIPFPFFDLAGIVAGVLKMRISAFLMAVSIGKSIKYVFLIAVGTVPIQLLQQLFN